MNDHLLDAISHDQQAMRYAWLFQLGQSAGPIRSTRREQSHAKTRTVPVKVDKRYVMDFDRFLPLV